MKRGAALAALLSVSLGTAATAQERGPVTNLPLPRYVSLKGGEGNARRGPGLSHRIDWVFTRRDMPLRITAEHEHWRRVEDRDGAGGWVHYALLSGVRTVIIDENLTPLYARPDPDTHVVAYLETGVVARVMGCDINWCRLNADGARGWASKSAFWGVEMGEIID